MRDNDTAISAYSGISAIRAIRAFTRNYRAAISAWLNCYLIAEITAARSAYIDQHIRSTATERQSTFHWNKHSDKHSCDCIFALVSMCVYFTATQQLSSVDLAIH